MVVERHVLLRDNQTADTLLPVSGGELVAKFGTSGLPDENFDEQLVVVAVCKENLVDIAGDGRFVAERGVLEGGGRRGCLGVEAVVVGVRRGLFIDVNVSRINSLASASDTVRLEDIVAFLWRVRALFKRCVGDSVVSACIRASINFPSSFRDLRRS